MIRRFGEEIGFGGSWDGRVYKEHHCGRCKQLKRRPFCGCELACFPRLSGACNVPRYHGPGGQDRCYIWAYERRLSLTTPNLAMATNEDPIFQYQSPMLNYMVTFPGMTNQLFGDRLITLYSFHQEEAGIYL